MGQATAPGPWHQQDCKDNRAPSDRVAPFYAKNRRDGSRLLSTALVICAVGLIRSDHRLGQWTAIVAGGLSCYWGLCYGRLER